jgi:hypothetical protein
MILFLDAMSGRSSGGREHVTAPATRHDQTVMSGPPLTSITMRALALIAVFAQLIAGACTPLSPAATAADNAAVKAAFERRAENVELTASGAIDRVLSDQDGPSGRHERFIVRLPDVGMTVLVEHNLSIAPRVPVAVGEPIVVHGEYVWNAQGGLLHFTHHDPDRSHEGGYIMYGGRRYE